MRVLLDTNRLSDILRHDEHAVRVFERAEEVFIPFVALAELKAGFAGGNPARMAKNEAGLLRLLQKPGVEVIFADGETLEVYARIFVQLRKAGTPIPTNDLWIASLAIQHQLPVLTRDGHFSKIAQVALC